MSRAELDESAAIMAAEFGSTGTYTPILPGNTDPVPVTPVMTYRSQVVDDFGAYELRDRANIDWAEYPDEPQQGDALEVDGDSYTVDTWEPVGSMWHIVLRTA